MVLILIYLFKNNSLGKYEITPSSTPRCPREKFMKKCDNSKNKLKARRINIGRSSGHTFEFIKKLQGAVNRNPVDDIRISIEVSMITKKPIVKVLFIPNRKLIEYP